jgi:hypothetical protein
MTLDDMTLDEWKFVISVAGPLLPSAHHSVTLG